MADPSLAHQLKALRVACAVAHAGSTMRAAELLHLSQSSVTRAIQAVEAVLGFALFERSSLGMRPTPNGHVVLQRAERALVQLAMSATPAACAQGGTPAWLVSRLAGSIGWRHLVVLVSLAQTHSETASASALGISQPAVHQTLAQLEHGAGSDLFLRGRRGLRLTEAGDALLIAVKLALAELAQADEELATRQGAMQGRVVIGTLPFSTGRLLSQAVGQVLRAHPGLAITIIDGTYDALVQQLRQAEIDMIVGALRPSPPGDDLQQTPLFADRLTVVARAGHPLARRATLAWADLHEAHWIMPMPHTPAQMAFEQALAAAGLAVPPSPLRVNSALMMQALLLQSDRLAMMATRQLQREIDAGLLVALPLPVQHAPRHIGVMRRAAQLPTPAVHSLLEALAEVAERIIEEPQAGAVE